MKNSAVLSCIVCLLILSTTDAGDWNQWRGSSRNGVDVDSPALVSSLPDSGLSPVWVAKANIPGAKSGGWGSPVVADGKVYLFTHQKEKLREGDLPPKKFPWLPPEKRVGMSDEEYAEYEVKRRDEDEARGKFYRFDETTYCLDAASGKTLWTNLFTSVYTRFMQSGSPAVVDGKLYILGAGRVARCIHAQTGKDVWKQKLPGEFRDQFLQSSFVVVDGVAIVLAVQLFGLDADTGSILWQTNEDTESQLHTSPVVWSSAAGSRVICNIPGGRTLCVDPKSGEEYWRVNSQAGHSTPIVVGDLLLTYGSSRKGGVRCFELSDEAAEHKWTCTRTADSGSSPVVVGDHVYVQGDRRVACISLADGSEQWLAQLDLNRPRYTSLVAADEKVIYGFEGLLCFAADASEYKLLMNAKIDKDGLLAEEASFRKMLNIDELEKTAEGQKDAERIWRQNIGNGGPLPCATPAMADGRIYFRLKDGIACYDLRAGRPE